MPTLIIGDNTGDDYSGTEDAFITSDDPGGNYSTGGNFEIKYTSGRNNALVSFSGLSNISNSAIVSEAYIYQYGSNPWESIAIHIRRLLVSWTESQCSFNNRATNTAWNTSGALGDGTDRILSASGTIYSTTVSQYNESSDLSSDVQNIVDGSYNNYGWVESRDTQDGWYYVQFLSSEGTDGQRPYLSVTYEEAFNRSILVGDYALVGGSLLVGKGVLIN